MADKFYEDMTVDELRAEYEEIQRRIETSDPDEDQKGWKQELKILKKAAGRRGIYFGESPWAEIERYLQAAEQDMKSLDTQKKTFVCENCGKSISVESRIYEKTYRGEKYCLDCRHMHGGSREGAGRPSIGVTRKVSITLPEEYWQAIEDDRGDMKLSAYLRELIIGKMDEIL